AVKRRPLVQRIRLSSSRLLAQPGGPTSSGCSLHTSAVSARSTSSSRSIRAALSSRRVGTNLPCTRQGSVLGGGMGPPRGSGWGAQAASRPRRGGLLLGGLGQQGAQGGAGVDQRLAGAAEVGDDARALPVQRAALSAQLDEAVGRLLGGA